MVDMNEYETNPQRHEDSSPEEQSHRPADAPHASSSPERGTSDTTAQQAAYQPAPQQPSSPAAPQAPISAQPQSAQPQSAQPQSVQPQQPQQPQFPQGQQQPGQWLGSPWQRGGQPHQPQYPAYSGGYQGQPQWNGQPQAPYGHTQQQPAIEGPQPQWNGADGQQWNGADAQQWNGQQHADAPIWATSVGTEQQQRDPEKARRGRRILVTGAVAVLIALGAGGVGAATALAFHDDSGSSSVQTGNSAVTRIVDRSSLAEIVSSVKDSVVSITTESGEGSGVVLNKDGYIVTNNHVVATATGKTVSVIFADGTKVQGTITGTDQRTDLAVVKVAAADSLKPATLGSSADMQVGDTVLALGSPLGLEGSVTEGIISAKDRTIQSSSEDEQQQQETPTNPFGGQQQQQQQQSQSSGTTSMSGLLQTDAPINPGNSGGALVNTNGQVIGINSAIATSGSSTGNIGLGFAIPSDKVKTVVQSLMKGEKVSHPALGVSVAEAEGGGAQVSTVTANSAAAKAGIEQGDVIKSVNGKAVNDSDDLVAIIQAGKVGDSISITFTRNGQEQTVSATLSEAS
ncbi:trypsin-like peptidase domain-containing protein [Winogradskya consettensis]|uniref:Peptidase S1 n=2 Tax=Winogradskya consettensis TaxID=113560 RepID=A0A919SCS6_9ACTN|nr:peptidase S1 [Actinoplanes consettensis]